MTAIRLGTCVLVAAAVLSFGGVESWGNAALEIGAALLFVLWAVLVTLRGRAEIFWNWVHRVSSKRLRRVGLSLSDENRAAAVERVRPIVLPGSPVVSDERAR